MDRLKWTIVVLAFAVPTVISIRDYGARRYWSGKADAQKEEFERRTRPRPPEFLRPVEMEIDSPFIMSAVVMRGMVFTGADDDRPAITVRRGERGVQEVVLENMSCIRFGDHSGAEP